MADYQNALDGAIPSIINAGFAMASSRKERDFAREMYERQLKDQIMLMEMGQSYNTGERESAQQFEETMWNKTNQYNTPSAQLARMLQAGINPNSAVGGAQNFAASGLSSSGQSSPGASVPSLTGHQVFNPEVSELGLIASQIGLNKAQKVGQQISNNYADDMNVATIAQIKQATALAKADMEYKQSMKGLSDKEVEWYDELQELAINEGSARIDQINAVLRQVDAEINKIEEEAETERRKRKSMDVQDAATSLVSGAQAESLRASANLAGEQAETEGTKRENINKDTQVKEQQRIEAVYKNGCRENDLNPDDPFVWRCIGKVISSGTKFRREAVRRLSSTLDSAKRSLIRVGVKTLTGSDPYPEQRQRKTILSPQSFSVQ